LNPLLYDALTKYTDSAPAIVDAGHPGEVVVVDGTATCNRWGETYVVRCPVCGQHLSLGHRFATVPDDGGFQLLLARCWGNDCYQGVEAKERLITRLQRLAAGDLATAPIRR
jgi:hypothetical protein